MALTPRSEFERPEKYVVPRVAIEVDDWLMLMRLEKVVDAEKRLLPLNVLLFERSVELAAVMVLEVLATMEVPLMVVRAPVR